MNSLSSDNFIYFPPCILFNNFHPPSSSTLFQQYSICKIPSNNNYWNYLHPQYTNLALPRHTFPLSSFILQISLKNTISLKSPSAFHYNCIIVQFVKSSDLRRVPRSILDGQFDFQCTQLARILIDED